MRKKRNHKAEWEKRSRESKLRNWYKSSDKKKGRDNDLSTRDVKILIEQPCFYCGKDASGGIDRKNSSIGHILSNCVACCQKCNMILVDLPFNAKIMLRDGLRQIRERELLKDWQPPPFRID